MTLLLRADLAVDRPVQPLGVPIDALLQAHGLRRTHAARLVLGWLLAHPDTSYTHAHQRARYPPL